MTHDSIGLGEDGPTHQPIEQLAAFARDPGAGGAAAADANETAAGWRALLERHGPVGVALTRRTCRRWRAPTPRAWRAGGYVLADASDGKPQSW